MLGEGKDWVPGIRQRGGLLSKKEISSGSKPCKDILQKRPAP